MEKLIAAFTVGAEAFAHHLDTKSVPKDWHGRRLPMRASSEAMPPPCRFPRRERPASHIAAPIGPAPVSEFAAAAFGAECLPTMFQGLMSQSAELGTNRLSKIHDYDNVLIIMMGIVPKIE